ncbi:MAG: beta-ketoacyl synthase N-terminal-like domain-containing protein, partial [Thermodesulfobacteriota bacterium]|nr:beta-ketoacyl synthase N-terminal-like domain-containing protein [Thermodesulfobacteriota bacterium]
MVSPPTSNPKPGVQKQVWITDIAAVTSLGSNLEELWQGLLSARTGIKPFSRFCADSYSSGVAACITGLSPPDGQSMIHGLLDLLFTERVSVPPDALLITATTKAGIDNLERLRRGTGGDPPDILPVGLHDTVSRRLGLNGKGFNISAACASSTIAVARAAALIAMGRAKVVVVCCLDLVTEFVFSGFSSLKILSPRPCQPFDRERNGLSLGEGAALLVLMDEDEACRNSRAHLGTVLGWGVA